MSIASRGQNAFDPVCDDINLPSVGRGLGARDAPPRIPRPLGRRVERAVAISYGGRFALGRHVIRRRAHAHGVVAPPAPVICVTRESRSGTSVAPSRWFHDEAHGKTVMFGIQRHKRVDIGKHLSACRKDIAALQEDSVRLAEDLATLASNGTSRIKEQASHLREQTERTSRNLRAALPPKSKEAQLTIFRRVAVALVSIASAALIGTFIARR